MTGDVSRGGWKKAVPKSFERPSPTLPKEKPADTQKTEKIAKVLQPRKSGTSGPVHPVPRKNIPAPSQENKALDKLVQNAKKSVKKSSSQSNIVSSQKVKSSGTQAPKKTAPTKKGKKTRPKRVRVKVHPKHIRKLNASIGKEALDKASNLGKEWRQAKTAIANAKQRLGVLRASKKPPLREIKKTKHDLRIAMKKLNQAKHKPLQTDSYGIETWEVAVKLNGQDHKAHVKEFPPGSYHGAKMDGFKVRQQLLHKSSKDWVKGSKKLKGERKKQALKHLDLLNLRFEMAYQKALKKPETKRFEQLSKAQKFDERFENAYKEIHEDFLQKIGSYAKDVESIINHAAGGKIIDQDSLAQAENAHVSNRDRPIIINTFKYGPKTFVGIQTPARRMLNEGGERVNAKTIPSTIRDQEGLVNYVTSSFGIVKEGEITILSEAIRHSSYSAKSLKDTELRQLIACRNVRSCLTDLAERKLMAFKNEGLPLPKTDKNSPLEVPLRTVLLLTTGIGDTALRNKSGGKWVGDAESTQLRDSAFSLSAYKGAVFKVDLGELGKVWIKGDIKFMNLGTNIGVTDIGVGKITKKKRGEQMVNATGFNEFDREFNEGVKKLEDGLEGLSKKSTKEIRTGIQFLLKYSSSMSKLQSSDSLKKTAEAHQNKIQWLGLRLEIEGEKARESQSKVTTREIGSPKLRAKLRGHYKEQRDAQDLLGEENQPIVDAKATLWKQNRGKILEAQAKFNTAMNALLKNKEIKGTKLEAHFQEYRDVMNNTLQARDIYHGKKYKIPGFLNEFQTLCIETHQLLGNNVDFFCKSAEDRTGRVDDRVMERQVFKAVKGYSPRTEADYTIMNQTITPVVHQYSPSQDNTEQNSGARGEQVTGKANPEQAHLFNTDRYHSQLAKKIFKVAKGLKGPSKDALMVMKT